MHKKPLVAVFVLGLLLMAAAVSWGAPAPTKDGAIPLTHGRGTRSTNLQTMPLETTPIVSAQAGTPLIAPGMLCSGTWMGARTFRIGGTFVGGETYMTIQDPTGALPISWPVAPVCTPLGYNSFNVTAVNMELSKRPTSTSLNPYTFALQPIIFDADVTTTPGCPLPGGVKCAGPVYAVTLTAGSTAGVTFLVNLPFVVECCVTGPYFAAFYLAAPWAAGIAQVTTDNALANPAAPTTLPPPQVCHQYVVNPDGSPPGLYDWGPYHNLRQWSDGYTPDDPLTQCTPGLCNYQWWYGGGRMDPSTAEFAYTIPNGSGSRSAMGVRLVSDCQDTLKSISFMGYIFAGAPDVVVEVWDPTPYVGCWTTAPGPVLRFTTTVLNSAIVEDPLINDVPTGDIVWGGLNGGLPQDLYVTIRPVGGRFALYAKTPTLGACGTDPHTVALVSGTWLHMGDYFGDQDEVYIDGYVCKEKCPIVENSCSPAGPDDWNTFAHDYQRTSASSMNLGDPCKVRAQWSRFMPRLSNFTNPVVAGDRVYVSSDNEVNSYDLATGIPGATVGVFPYTGGVVRSNVTVEGNRVFLTGGNARAVSCWSADLTTNFWSNSQVDPGLPGINLGDNGALPTQNRFGSTAVYAVGLDSIVVVSTEKTGATNSGRLYALDVQTGFLYAGWGANNPIVLDKGAFHAPAYDGTNLFVGTADNVLGNGSIYSFNAATGAQNWNYKDLAAADEGFPSGVSVGGGIVYAASMFDQATDRGHRYAIDKTTGVPNWRFLQGGDLWAPPTIGRNFVYIPQNIPSAGLLMVDKPTGKAVYNWVADGVGPITGPVTLTCDKYLFAGDRAGMWWLLNASDQSVEWRRTFFGIMNGTALAHHSNGDDYAVVSARGSATGPAGAGVVTGWRLNQTVRPFLQQLVSETPQILIPLNSGDGLGPYTESDVYANEGCVNLNVLTTNYFDPSPAAKTFTQIQQKYAAAYVDRKIGSDYVSYFEGGQPSKKARMAGVGVMADEELTVLDKELEAVHSSFAANGARRATAAGAMDILRTHTVTYSDNPILPGGTTDLTWSYDGTNLGRGLDDEIIESVTDDPDFYPEDLDYSDLGHPSLSVHYVGGCPNENVLMTWNTLGATNTEKVYNWGSLGGMKSSGDNALDWGADPSAGNEGWLFDGGLVLVGDSSAQLGGALVRIGLYSDNARNYVADPRLSDNTCGLDGATDIRMGYRSQGPCPGTAVPIFGSWVRSVYSDTNEKVPGTSPLATMGLTVIQYEVGANDPMYGDFKLIRFELHNRDAVDKPNIYAGTFVDWDIAAGTDNTGAYSDVFDGYYQRSTLSANAFAYGLFVPEQPSAYCGVDPVPNSPHRIEVVSNPDRVYTEPWGNAVNHGKVWHQVVTQQPTRGVDNGATTEDKSGLLINKPVFVPASGMAAVHQALYAVDGSSHDDVVIAGGATDIARRAARWGGWARGDVNDDGCINLADVCFLHAFAGGGSVQIYPDTYCGDVNLVGGQGDAADVAYLFAYVSGLGPAPLGAWRFAF